MSYPNAPRPLPEVLQRGDYAMRSLGVDVHFCSAAAMPGGQQHAAATALVLHVLGAAHHVGDAA
jgi:hypothetical protein